MPRRRATASTARRAPVAKVGGLYKGLPNIARHHPRPHSRFGVLPMTAIRGAAAAVTGAASGIGRALACELAARGCDLALADRDEAGLATLAAEIARSYPQKVTA